MKFNAYIKCMERIMEKVKCSVCVNEDLSFCRIKKVKVKLNKKRLCKHYTHDENKLVKKQDIKITKAPFTMMEENKKLKKAEQKRLREVLKRQKLSETVTEDFNKIYNDKLNNKHPLTGDLSRFVSTGVKGVTE
jgi:hypothetical protein